LVYFGSRKRFGLVLVAVTVVATVLAGGCSKKPLPEDGTPAERLYVKHCGTCHRAYRPGLLTPTMWETMMSRMELEMKRRGTVMTRSERDEIMAYLLRNAGGR
jgi:mono/diheme cytochrome c family protein